MLKNRTPRLPVIGRIKLGELTGPVRKSNKGREYRAPGKLDHIRLTLNARGEDGNYLIDTAAHAALGDPRPTSVPIVLLFDDIDRDLATEMNYWSAGRLICHGDGEDGRWYGKDGKLPGAKPEAVKCVGCQYRNQDANGAVKCKPHAILRCIVPAAGRLGGIHELRTSSEMSVDALTSSLAFIGMATGGHLAWIPLDLCVRPVKLGGNRGTVWVAHLEFRGDRRALIATAIEERRQLAAGGASIVAASQLVEVSMPSDVDDDEARSVSNEFAPEGEDDGDGDGRIRLVIPAEDGVTAP